MGIKKELAFYSFYGAGELAPRREATAEKSEQKPLDSEEIEKPDNSSSDKK